jgi:nicotinamidase-related amidase
MLDKGEIPMAVSDTALLVVDAQESFRHRPYWSQDDLPFFLCRLQALIEGARQLEIPIVQIFHVEDDGAFSLASGYVTTMAGLSINSDAVFHKRQHSALAGSGLEAWLAQQKIRRVVVAGIRTEQCCETTARHASDSGYKVDFVSDATLTFAMTGRNGREWSPQEIKERTELVLDGRFARVASVEEALAGRTTEVAA